MTSYFPNCVYKFLFIFGLAWDFLFTLFQLISIIKWFFGKEKWNSASPLADEDSSHYFLQFGPINKTGSEGVMLQDILM